MTSRNLTSKLVLADEDLPPSPDFADEAVRRRLGPSAVTLFTALCEAWKMTKEESRQLLALASATGLDHLDPAQISEEQLFRISYLVGIYKAVHISHSDELADCWVGLPSTKVMFGSQAPLAHMIHGGVDALAERAQTVRCPLCWELRRYEKTKEPRSATFPSHRRDPS